MGYKAFPETEIVQQSKEGYGETHVLDKTFYALKWRIVSLFRHVVFSDDAHVRVAKFRVYTELVIQNVI